MTSVMLNAAATTALTTVSTGHSYSQADLDALKDTIAKDCSEPQFKVFCVAFTRLGLDPFARQIVPIVQGGRMTPQVTIDGFRLIAERTGKYLGQLGPFWCGDDGKWQEAWLLDKAPTACRVGVIREGFREVMWGTARTKAYAKGGQWTTMPDVMIAKVAESIALRKAFPNELSGVYTREEMQQALVEENEPYIEAAHAPQSDPIEPVTITATWQGLRKRALLAGAKTMDQWEALVRRATHKDQGLTDADKASVVAAIERLEAKKAKELRAIPVPEFTFTVDETGEMLTPDPEQPHDLTTVDARLGA